MKSALYHEVTGQFVPEVAIPPEQDATLAQLETNWKKHPHTAKLHKELSESISTLIDAAISQAANYHQHNNHLQIIEKLIRANELRNLKDKIS